MERLISWEEYARLIQVVADKVQSSGDRFDLVIAVARGGLLLGDALSRQTGAPLGIHSISSYDGKTSAELREPDFPYCGPSVSGNILLADDLVDTGQTLNYLCQKYGEKTLSVKTATIWKSETSASLPDFYAETKKESEWIVQPFEKKCP